VSADNGEQRLLLQDVCRAVQWAVEECQVGDLARAQLAAPILLEGGVGSLHGEAVKSLGRSELLVGKPATGRLTGGIGSSDGGKEPEPWIAQLDREVAAEGHVDVGVEEPSPSIGPGQPGVAQPCLGHGDVAGGMGGLHRGDDAELGEARDVGGIGDLCVLDAESRGGSDAGAGVGFEDVVVRRVADGVGRELETGGEGSAGGGLDLIRWSEDQAGVLGVIGVGRLEKRAPGAECPVGVELDGAEGEEVVGAARLGTSAEGFLERPGLAAPVRIDAKLEATGPSESAVDVGGLGIDAHLVDGGEALGGEKVLGAKDGCFDLGVAGEGDGALEQVFGTVDEDPGRFAAGVVVDAAPGRIRSVAGDLGAPEGFGIGPGGVAVDASEEDGRVGSDGIEGGPGGELFVRETGLVPAPPLDPGAGG
jgi:hypothetical protein